MRDLPAELLPPAAKLVAGFSLFWFQRAVNDGCWLYQPAVKSELSLRLR
jgi:hypothetical protein